MSERGGRLAIELGNAIVNKAQSERHPDLKTGDCVRLCVRDTGQGIPTNIIDKIFEPYFTTKDVNEGSGMGLAVVHGIAKTHGSAVLVDSEPGRGTVFEVFFPSSGKAVLKKDHEEITFPTGTESILFVDDEAAIVKMGNID